VRAHDPDVPTAFLVHGLEVTAAVTLAAEHGHRWLHPDVGNVLARPEVVGACHAAGLLVDVWTVDDPEHMRALTDAGVDAVITNVPDVAVATLHS
jgi:glycerophosphoryl diester phosphodiesterase